MLAGIVVDVKRDRPGVGLLETPLECLPCSLMYEDLRAREWKHNRWI